MSFLRFEPDAIFLKETQMTETIKIQIVEVEEQLRQAMIASDISTLNALLAPSIVITNHLGQLVERQADIAAHESGLIKIHALNASEQKIQILGEVAIVSVRMQIQGNYNGSPANGDFRFTRVWAVVNGAWHIVAAHIGAVV